MLELFNINAGGGLPLSCTFNSACVATLYVVVVVVVVVVTNRIYTPLLVGFHGFTGVIVMARVTKCQRLPLTVLFLSLL